jgi:hypothetical protein
MKKIIYGISFLFLLGILIISCQKEVAKDKSVQKQIIQQTTKKLDISLDEFQQIINSNNSTRAASGWWQRFKKWVKAHSGNSQKYVDGEPVCAGHGGCGPCPGVCFRKGIIDGGDNEIVSEKEFAQGWRAIAFSIFENKSNHNIRKMVIQIPSEYETDFILNNVFEVENNERLPSFYSKEAGFHSITIKSGIYPVIRSPKEGMTKTIVNIMVE